MAKPVANTLFGALVACVAAGALSAQPEPKEVFDEAVKQLRLNNKTGALEKFQEVIKLDPTNAQAWKLWELTDKEIWRELIMQEASTAVLRNEAQRNGMTMLRDSG